MSNGSDNGGGEITFMKMVLLISSIASLVVLVAAAYDENFRGEWRQRQTVYKDLLIGAADSDNTRRAAQSFGVEHKQIFLEELGRIDRCTTCHLGVSNPAMVGVEAPLGSHSGDLLRHHPTEKFGCTFCHSGQGRSIDRAAAHGWHEDGTPVEFMDTPLLRGPAVYTRCGVCHYEVDLYGGEADLFGQVAEGEGAGVPGAIDGSSLSVSLPGADALAVGKRLTTELGCLGCHKYRGRGGVLGPDLTYVGDKTRHDFDFTHVHGEHTVEQWLFEHFRFPKEVSPGTQMPDFGLSDDQARNLALYMMSLHRKTVPSGYRPASVARASRQSVPVDGETLYRLFCSACHGRDGFGSTMRAGLWPVDVDPWGREWESRDVVVERGEQFDLPVPSLNHPDTLAVASDDYLRSIIASGRAGTNMIGWHADEGGLTDSEIERLVQYIREWQGPGPPVESVSVLRGDPRFGRALYRTRCTSCHGSRGEGGIGVALSSPSFLESASDEFLRDAIINGRANTAMPAWKRLSADDVSDLIAYLRTYQSQPADEATVLASLAENRKPSRRALRIGKSLYRANCALCHGSKGESALGPSLNTEEFLSVTDDRYLYTALVQGRPGTAMPAWRHLSAEDLVDIINYVRSLGKHDRRELQDYRAYGDWDRGRIIFRGTCAGCHGAYAEGGTGPQLNNPVLLASASDAMLREWISYGRFGTPMLGFRRGQQGVTEMSDSQIEDVVTYLRRFEMRPRVVSARPGLGIVPLGAEVYASACASCHGPDGQGATGSALSNPDFLRAASDGFLEATIVLGRDGTEMRPMGKGSQGNVELSAEDVSNVVAFIRSWEHEVPSVDIPHRYVIGAAVDEGLELFTGHCAGCHGHGGKDGWAPALSNEQFLAAATDGFLQATIAVGRSNTAMRAFGRGGGGVAELSAEQIDNIVAYIRTWADEKHKPVSSPEGAEQGEQTTESDSAEMGIRLGSRE